MKIKFLIYLVLLSSVINVLGQTKYRTSSGKINFNASTPLEDIDATNEEVNAILELESGKFATVMLIKDFQFRRKLMQEHFNENYMESDKYPKAIFTGIIEDLDLIEQGTEEQQQSISGEITIHGVKRPLKTKATVKMGRQSIVIRSEFMIKPEDHNIEVPRIVFQKIAREVKVDVELVLRRMSSD